MFLTTFQGTLSSFIVFSVLNKEEIALLQRLLEARTRKKRKREKSPTAGAVPSDGCAMAQGSKIWCSSLRLKC
jgi:hypothetical protein